MGQCQSLKVSAGYCASVPGTMSQCWALRVGAGALRVSAGHNGLVLGTVGYCWAVPVNAGHCGLVPGTMD